MKRWGSLFGCWVALGGHTAQEASTSLLNWRYDTYEPEAPVLASPLKDAKLTVSGQWSDRGPHFVTDGKIEAGNHWACEQLPAVLTIEMRETTRLSACRVWPYFGEPRVYKFFVEASPDNQAWTRVVDWTRNERPATAEGFAIPFERQVEAKYVRVTITDSSVRGAGGHIVEFQVAESALIPGLHGRHVPTERITAANAQGDEALKTWRAAAWRNERAHGQFVVWSPDAVPQLRLCASALRSDAGAEIPAAAVLPRFVRYVLADKQLAGDILDTAEQGG
ncbi:MAG TPA: discoidin domain-containing protein [Kiritimatiellia bacterium]|nr:discoidin domain-containing protein [Kiritimatiellia bacterium]HPS08727.1 discoidin domain-containing protein [Kiritimatiellia bacterium]